jgi:Transposase DDE domain group 1
LRLFNAYYDEYGFRPIVVFDGDGRLVGAVLRPARRPDGREIVTLLRRRAWFRQAPALQGILRRRRELGSR